MTTMERTLLVLGGLNGRRVCRKEEETFVETTATFNGLHGEDYIYTFRWSTGNTLDIFKTSRVKPEWNERMASLYLNASMFLADPIRQAMAIVGIIEADMCGEG